MTVLGSEVYLDIIKISFTLGKMLKSDEVYLLKKQRK